ncbi:hypothetical protein E4U55_000440 [Claviceps digitariae]|nr:hypothetical protein E4U55_000440 [Claviceps digitariae]
MYATSILKVGFGIQHAFIFRNVLSSSTTSLIKECTWAKTPIGPDGPWNAVQVSIGRDSQPLLALFAGNVWQTTVLTSSYCAKNASVVHCAAGTYSKDKAISDELKGVQYKSDAQKIMSGVQIKGKNVDTYFDDCDVVGEVPNCSLSLVDDQMMSYPGGQWYPLFAGCLSVGAPSMYQSYSQQDGSLINATIFPWYLYSQNAIASSSFGMHIGSALPSSRLSGSLNFGGFDKNRVTGDVLTLNGGPSQPVTLTDISIDVIKGQSPFHFSNKAGLLASGNSSIPKGGISVTIDGCSPYLTLPKSTCDSISLHLPVTYNVSLGLFLWKTDDPDFKRIMSSASALAFSFMGADSTKSITIKIPFQHLNLTLEPPLVDASTSYFPCSTGGTGSYVLGRAFLQDAFVAGNWHKRTWWLAQAPGPSIPNNPHLVAISPDDIFILGNSNDWISSWDRVWTSLAASDDSIEPPPPSAPTTLTGSSVQSGLSVGAKAGIGAGLGIVVLVLVGFVIVLCWRKRQSQRHVVEGSPASFTAVEAQAAVELPGSAVVDRLQSEVHELS